MIKTTKSIDEANAITHGGVFHEDEVFASVILSYTCENTELVVARVFQVPENCSKLVYDIGGGKYDHHQKEKERRQDKDETPYAAVGLIWRDFGKTALEKMGIEDEFLYEVWDRVDRSLIKGIDASDNGITVDEKNGVFSLRLIISMFNRLWDEQKETDEETDKATDEAFLEACAIADQVFRRTVDYIASELRGERIIKMAMEKADGKVIVLDKYVPWKRCVCSEDQDEKFWYIVFPTIRKGYNVQCVPNEPDSNIMRHGLPESWRGLSVEELRQVTGVSDALFVHPTGYIGGAQSLEGALLMAEKAVNYKKDCL